MNTLRALIISGVTLLYLFSCTTNTLQEDIAGSGTLSGNPVITGAIYAVDGKTPATDITIIVRKKDFVSSRSPAAGNSDSASIYVTHTNQQGVFAVASIDTGAYLVEGSDDQGNYSLSRPFSILDTAIMQTLPNDTLKASGCITGRISLANNRTVPEGYVLAFGVDRFTTIDTSGSFLLGTLPEGTYTIRLLPLSNDYALVDSGNISVTAGKTTDIGTVTLPFIGTPDVASLTLDYDTAKQIVKVSWPLPEGAPSAGFNLYRRNNQYDTIFTKLNSEPLTEPLYSDSFCLQNQQYYYYVSVVGSNTFEVSASDTDSVIIATYFTPSDTFYQNMAIIGDKRNIYHTLATNGIDKIYSINKERSSISVIDFNGTDLGVFYTGNLLSIGSISVDRYGMVYASEWLPNDNLISRIIKIAPNGDVAQQYPIATSDSGSGIGEARLFTADYHGNIILVNGTQDSLILCDTAGIEIMRIEQFTPENIIDGFGKFALVTTDTLGIIYAYQFQIGVLIFNPSTKSRTWLPYNDVTARWYSFDPDRVPVVPVGQPLYSIAVDPENGRLYIAAVQGLSVLEPDYSLCAGYSYPGFLTDILIVNDFLFATDGRNIVKFNNRLP